MPNAKNLKELKDGNPWNDFGYHVAKTPPSGIGWCCEEDLEILKGEKKQRIEQLCLAPNPVPWSGRWNSSKLPRLVILSLNPGSGYDNDNNDGKSLAKGDASDDEFSNLINLNLNGECGMSEFIFSSAVFSRSGYTPGKKGGDKKVSYWVEKLYPLYKASVKNPMKKEEIYLIIRNAGVSTANDERFRQAKDFFDSILTVELFPYHTDVSTKIGALFRKGELIFPSSKFNVDLVRYMIDKGATVIVARSKKLWEQALGEDINKCLILNNPQQTYISEGNFSKSPKGTWDKLKNLWIE